MQTDAHVIKQQLNSLVQKDQKIVYRDIAVEAMKHGIRLDAAGKELAAIAQIERAMNSGADEDDMRRLNRQRSELYVEYGRILSTSPAAVNFPDSVRALIAKNEAVENQIRNLGQQLIESAVLVDPMGERDGNSIGQSRRYVRLISVIVGLAVLILIIYMTRGLFFSNV